MPFITPTDPAQLEIFNQINSEYDARIAGDTSEFGPDLNIISAQRNNALAEAGIQFQDNGKDFFSTMGGSFTGMLNAVPGNVQQVLEDDKFMGLAAIATGGAALGAGGLSGTTAALGMEGMGIGGTALGEGLLTSLPAGTSNVLSSLGANTVANAVTGGTGGGLTQGANYGTTDTDASSVTSSSKITNNLSPEQMEMLNSIIGSTSSNIKGTNPQADIENLLRTIVPQLVQQSAQQYVPRFNAGAVGAGVGSSTSADSVLATQLGNTINSGIESTIAQTAPQFYDIENQQLAALSDLFKVATLGQETTNTTGSSQGQTGVDNGLNLGDKFQDAAIDAGIQYGLEWLLGG